MPIIEKIELSTVSFNEASLVPQALFCRWFQPNVINLRFIVLFCN